MASLTQPGAEAESMPPHELDHVLSAMQRKSAPQVYDAFVAWTKILDDPSSPLHESFVRQVQELPGPTFSEMLRSLDPTNSSLHDVAHGLNIMQGQTRFVDFGDLVDQYGVRTHHRNVLDGMQALMALRSQSRHGLTASDYEIFMRCAGAAVDYQAIKEAWNGMAKDGLQETRTAKTWTEFIKARYMTEPTYYQFDRSRVAVQARDMYRNRLPLPMAALKRMDRVRMSINALKREPWNRRPDEPEEDLRRLLRRRADFRGYRGHWIRALYYGHEMDEELLCASMMAFARSSSLHAIETMILKAYYGINIREAAAHAADPIVSGGIDFPSDSPTRPTERLLHCIVEAFGSMSRIRLGTKLVDFISRRYGIPISHETWSNLLSWTYLCASKPFQPTRKLLGDFEEGVATAAYVREVWRTMTSAPHRMQPAFEDYDSYIKALIHHRSFRPAIEMIREYAVPHYNRVVEEYQRAVLDEVLQNDMEPFSTAQADTRSRRKKAQIRKDHVHNCIAAWFSKLLKTASANKSHRGGIVMRVLIPDLIREFPEFFQHQVRYRTAQGIVNLERADAICRFDWTKVRRTILPQKVASFRVRELEATDEPDFEWPRVPAMKVFEWQRKPKRRLDRIGRAPQNEDKRAWWKRLEQDLIL
ncbi:hypothetical protein RJ55_07578 [Drechmeria coniospora]|nr:hypothetical protein RJ55_07578 [Drechmeria coniospora]